jgi:hypothetical protein
VNAIPDDPESVGTYVTFGRFRTLHLGDLTIDKEFELVCPTNRIGTVDLLLGLHHGQDTSNSVPLVHAVQPKVAIMNNGTRKGGWPQVMRTLYTSPGFEDVWQMHFSLLSGQEYTAPGLFIANGVDDQASVMPVAPQPLPQTGIERAASTGPQRARVLDKGVSATRRNVHRDQSAHRLFEGVSRALRERRSQRDETNHRVTEAQRKALCSLCL